MADAPGNLVESPSQVDAELDRLASRRATSGQTLDSEFSGFLERQTQETYFISYRHPVVARKNWLRRASSSETRRYLTGIIFPDRMEGLDLLVAPEDFKFVLIFNHDGEVVLVEAPDQTF